MGKLKYAAFALFFLIISCEKDILINDNGTVSNSDNAKFRFGKTSYKTKHIVIVVVDGARYSETWGHPDGVYIPYMKDSLSEKGILNSQFYNLGNTYTVPGHIAITTGNYENKANNGSELPENPSIFQYYLSKSGKPKNTAGIIASKGKLEVLSNCKNVAWRDNYIPYYYCGINGAGVNGGYANDSNTFRAALNYLKNNETNLLLINFKEPDNSGHQGKWKEYLQGIRKTDEYIYQLYNFLQTDSMYSGTTTLFVTNDHGRHLDSVSDSFVSHGDGCEGCRHISLFAIGPDFKEDCSVTVSREQIDISATVAELLSFEFPSGKGDVMWELFHPTIPDEFRFE